MQTEYRRGQRTCPTRSALHLLRNGFKFTLKLFMPDYLQTFKHSCSFTLLISRKVLNEMQQNKETPNSNSKTNITECIIFYTISILHTKHKIKPWFQLENNLNLCFMHIILNSLHLKLDISNLLYDIPNRNGNYFIYPFMVYYTTLPAIQLYSTEWYDDWQHWMVWWFRMRVWKSFEVHVA